MKFLVVCVVVFMSIPMAFSSDMAKHERLALENLQLTNSKKMLEEIISAQAQQVVAINPNVDVMEVRAHMQQIMGWDVLKEDLIEIGMRYFSVDELKQINDFYRSDIGKVYAEKGPAMSSELSRLIMVNMQKLMSQPAPAPASNK